MLIKFGSPDFGDFMKSFINDAGNTRIVNVLIVASITFVAYEGFQLIINAISEMKSPEKNISRGIYLAITLAIVIYVLISIGALLAIPSEEIIKNKEYALAAGAGGVLILLGGLELILEFGSITFLLVSLLISIADFKIRKQAKSSSCITVSAISLLSICCILILYYEFTTALNQMLFIIALYIFLTVIAFFYAVKKNKKPKPPL